MSATADITRYRDYFKELGRGERVEVVAIPSPDQRTIFQRRVFYLEQVKLYLIFVALRKLFNHPTDSLPLIASYKSLVLVTYFSFVGEHCFIVAWHSLLISHTGSVSLCEMS